MRLPILSSESRVGLYVIAILAVQMAVYQATVWYPDWDTSVDAPYHVAMGDLFGKIAWRRTFPATYMSVWATHFADKELGFHLLLGSLRRWAGLFGYRGEGPPFALEMGCLLAAFMASLIAALRVLGVRPWFVFLPLVWFGVPLFTARMAMVRPHCLSVTILVLTAALLAERVDLRRQLWRMGILGFLLAYLHSNPHFILLPTGCYGLAALPERGWRAWLPAGAAALGVVAGMTLHPQFPNTFLIWKIQCVDVVLQAVCQRVPDLAPTLELLPPTRELVVHSLALPVLACGALAAALHRARRGAVLPVPLRLFLLLTVVTTAGFLVSRRVVEYAVPFTVLTVALVYQDIMGSQPWRAHLACLALTLGLGVALSPLHLAYQGGGGTPIPRSFAAWARERLPPGTRIANFRWDDFPGLFFAAPEYAYAYGLDPLFADAACPGPYRRLERIFARREPVPAAAELRQLLQARLLFVSLRHHALARHLAHSGLALAYQGVDGWCFDLGAPRQPGRLDPDA
jgi:hypothetical protein